LHHQKEINEPSILWYVTQKKGDINDREFLKIKKHCSAKMKTKRALLPLFFSLVVAQTLSVAEVLRSKTLLSGKRTQKEQKRQQWFYADCNTVLDFLGNPDS